MEGNEWTLSKKHLPTDCLGLLENFIVPFLAPVASVWDENLKKLMGKYFEQKLKLPQEKLSEICGGTCELFQMQTQYDLSIRNGNGEEVIAMEYKLHRDPLSVNDLTLIFDKIYANSTCRIGFIVAVNFAPALKKEQDWKDLSPTCISPAHGAVCPCN